ncbi:MAG: type IV secretion system DNA-binding domain-containing protein [Patescibacteria group bacterium]
MFLVQLSTDTQYAAASAGDNFLVSKLIFVFLGLLIVCAGILYIIKLYVRSRVHAKSDKFKTVLLQISLPKFRREEEVEKGVTKDQVHEAISVAESFFHSIAGMKAQRGLKTWVFGRADEISFEIISQHKLIKYYISVPLHLRTTLEQNFSAAYPDANIEEVEDYNIFSPNGIIVGSYLAMRRPGVFPVKTYMQMETDPLNAITNVLSKIPEGEGAAFQFIARSAPGKWRQKGLFIARNMQQGMTLGEAMKGGRKKKTDFIGEALGTESKDQKPDEQHRLTPQEDEMVKGLEQKANKGGMDVCIRLIVSGKNEDVVQTTMGSMLNAFSQYNIYEHGNSFVRVVPPFRKKMIQKFIHRSFDEKNRILLNSEEMASIWHLPLPWTETPNIQWLGARRGAAPAEVPGKEDGQIELGYNTYRGVRTDVWMKESDRQRHMYIIGKSGSGKSQLIAKLAIQDIQRGAGVGVIDPHGDLVDHILANVPKERADDIVYFCPADLERPMGLNMLEAKDDSMKDMAVQEMIAIFYKLFPPEMIGPMFEHNMRNVMLTLMSDLEYPGTIAEIPRMFSDEDFQKSWVDKVKDPVVRSFWEKEMAKTSDFHKSEMLGYLISKVGRFVENEMMRNIIGQQHSSFNLREVMDKGKILLVNLSKGRTGDVNAELLGMIIVSKLQMAALQRADMPEEDRKDFYLYIDEFQNFITDSIATILSEARKYRLDLIIAHQYTGQLVKNNDTKIRDAVFGNVGTMFTSRIGPEDVELLEKMYSPEFTGYDLINSDKFTWYVKMIVDNSQKKPFTMNFESAPKGDKELLKSYKELSRFKYGRDRAIVEAEIMERTQLGSTGDAPQHESLPPSY